MNIVCLRTRCQRGVHLFLCNCDSNISKFCRLRFDGKILRFDLGLEEVESIENFTKEGCSKILLIGLASGRGYCDESEE